MFLRKIALFLLVFTLTSSQALGAFVTVYDGYGTVSATSTSVELMPKVSTTLSETHSGLVVSDSTFTGDYEITFKVKNIDQLRENDTPNAWEAPWVVFGYKDIVNSLGQADQSFTYLILKPNGYGLELGEALPLDGQTFLYTSTFGQDTYSMGVEYAVKITVINGEITVYVDGVKKFSFKDTSKSTLTLDGKIGFYSEDAHVLFSEISISSISNASTNGVSGGTNNTSVSGSSSSSSTSSTTQTDLQILKEKMKKKSKEQTKAERMQSMYGVNSAIMSRGRKERVKLTYTGKKLEEVQTRNEVLRARVSTKLAEQKAYFKKLQVKRRIFD